MQTEDVLTIEIRRAADFFISYTRVDEEWAEWVAWLLEIAGYSVILQAWDFRPGHNFVFMMHQAASTARHTILILTPSFLEAVYTQAEWTAAFAHDPRGIARKLIPLRVQTCNPAGLLRPIIYVDLVDVVDEQDAILRVLEGVRMGRGKPTARPHYPGRRSLRVGTVISDRSIPNGGAR